jgi:hypothetical protein
MEARQPMHTDSLPTVLLLAALGLVRPGLILALAAAVSTAREDR